MKFLIWLAIAALIVAWLVRGKKNAQGATGKEASAAEKMVQCRHCGVHFPASDAITDIGGAVFCCEAHRRSRNA